MRPATGRMLRDDWRMVGVALLVGRAECLSPKTGKLNNKKFGEWCEANGFGSIPNTVRSNALWLADEWDRVHSVLTPLQDSHPNNIRAAFRKATKISEETAAKAMKLFRRSVHPRGTPAYRRGLHLRLKLDLRVRTES